MAVKESFPASFSQWLGDAAVRACSVAARGLLADLYCMMADSRRKGYLINKDAAAVSLEQLAELSGCSNDLITVLLDELLFNGVLMKTKNGILYSPNILRNEKKRALCRKAGKISARKRRENDAENKSRQTPCETTEENSEIRSTPCSTPCSTEEKNTVLNHCECDGCKDTIFEEKNNFPGKKVPKEKEKESFPPFPPLKKEQKEHFHDGREDAPKNNGEQIPTEQNLPFFPEDPAEKTKATEKSFRQLTEEEFSAIILDFPEFRDIALDFVNYWAEKNSVGKMRFQLEKTWEHRRRLLTWAKRQPVQQRRKGLAKNEPYRNGNSAEYLKNIGSAEPDENGFY